ncbi:MAG: AraC family transcriptional regulator [Pseudomonadota bacterium]
MNSMPPLDLETDSSNNVWALQPHAMMDGTVNDMVPTFDQIDSEMSQGHFITGIKIRVPPSLGQGSWKIMKVSPYLYMMTCEVTYRDRHVVHVAEDKMAKVRILLAGKVRQINANVTLNGTGAFLEAYPGDVASHYELQGGTTIRLVILNCGPRFFTKTLSLSPFKIPAPLNHVFEEKGQDSIGNVVPLRPDVLRAANEIYRAQSRFSRELLRSYQYGKGVEIACSVISGLESKTEVGVVGAEISVRDIGRVEEAREIILSNIEQVPTIPEIARMIGVNQTKLKSIFKLAYGMTIHEFTQKGKMDLALDLLHERRLSISEIGQEVGYDFPASFTHAFKRYYGLTPREMKKSISQN